MLNEEQKLPADPAENPPRKNAEPASEVVNWESVVDRTSRMLYPRRKAVNPSFQVFLGFPDLA